jgi:hypothetical protein
MRHKYDTYDIPSGFKKKKLNIIFAAAIIIIAFLTVYSYLNRSEPMKITAAVVAESLYIFFPKDGTKLAQNVIQVKSGLSEKQKADELINELKKQKCVPEKLTLHDFATDDGGIMYLNFSKEILNDKTAGSLQEINMTYAIVNTFIYNFRNNNKVQLLVEGYPTETINGIIYIYKPIEFNKDLLEE